MPDSSELVKTIIHYQKALDRYSDSRNDAKVNFFYILNIDLICRLLLDFTLHIQAI